MIDRLEAAEKERDALRAKVEQLTEAEAVMWRNAFEYQADAERLRAKIERMTKRLRLILEEPENTMSNSKALREMVRQARLALEESK